MWDEQAYRRFFRTVNGGNEPYGFQVDVARRLVEGKSLVLRAPTGSGKTAAVLAPFLYPGWRPRPTRLIYALPLRTLAQAIFKEAQWMVQGVGCDAETTVTIQTGEQPDDPFFDRGRIIVATYDQVLSGLLLGPYGLSRKLHNVNAAAIAGALVVFDEFHLMEPQRAFLTGIAGLHLFRGLTQSVWMTATATPALVRELSERIGAEPAGPSAEELAKLPSVSTVSRRLIWAGEPLSAALVAKHLDGRVVVIVNTVPRAQTIYEELTKLRPDVPPMLLHARFFQTHRRDKERQLRDRFGKKAKGPALLVATQVVEAGVDISCDHLFTELAPMNSLVQRAGRCARFEGEVGTVHVHPLPEEPRSWLPYGDLREPSGTLAATKALLEQMGPDGAEFTPTLAARWVEMVHGPGDARALAGLWQRRVQGVRDQIYQTAIVRNPAGVTDLIREPDTDDRAVIVTRQATLPERPGCRESLKVSRWRLAALIREARETGQRIGWYWAGEAEPPWQPLTSEEQLLYTFAVALHPDYARYNAEVGLIVGKAGEEESPVRQEPPRPGHNPLRAETWAEHVRAVAAMAQGRVERDGSGAWLGLRFAERYGLPVDVLDRAAQATGLCHDLGKLQKGWQQWAAAYQGLCDPGYRHVTPLAHTDFDPGEPKDRERENQVKVRRPDHSAAGAYLSVAALSVLLGDLPSQARAKVVSTCVAAVLAHHGGWLQSEGAAQQHLGIQELWPGASRAIVEVLGDKVQTLVGQVLAVRDRRKQLMELLAATTGSETLEEWWPLVAYVTRTLRLADQRATEEGGKGE